MTPVPASSARPESPLFADGLGDRVVCSEGATGELLQVFKLRPALTAVPSFEFALRERTARLANFRHAYYSRVRRIDRAMNPTPSLAVVSDHVEGIRLSEILRVAGQKKLQLDISAALCLIRQLVPAVALLHENARDVAHGTIAAERLVVTPHARLVIVEHVLGSSIEQLHWSRERLWREFRIAMPPSAGVPRFDHRADVTGIGMVALALVLGRPIGADEFPHQIPSLLEHARASAPGGQPLADGLRTWLARALQIDGRRAFASAPEALAALDEFLADDSGYVAAPVALETFLSRYIASLVDDPVPAPEPMFMPPAEPVRVEPEPVRGATANPAPPPPELSALMDVSDLRMDDEPDAAEPVKPPFDAEAPFAVPVPEPVPAATRPRGFRRWLGAVAVLVLLAGVSTAGYVAYAWYGAGRSAPAMGTLVVQSTPAGVQVFVDGVDRGVTPARLAVAPGAHILELRGRGIPRVIPLTVTAGAEVSQYLEFAETPVTGQLAIQSEPAGARVIVDGTERGVAPMTVQDLAPGQHEVTLVSDAGSFKHTVIVQAGAIASLVAPMTPAAPAGPVSGWLSVKAPFSVEIHEGGRIIGTTDADRIMLAAGRHDLEFVNASLDLRLPRTVTVVAGKVTPLTLELPRGVVHLNAAPWAEVWIDGQRAGETPLGNVSLTVGPHEVVFRHPQFGEKRHAIAVTAGTPVRVSVSMK